MQATPPNLFAYATSELSQDAFVCWLAAWANPALREVDRPLHATAVAFVKRLIETGGVPVVSEILSIAVRRQRKNIDVLLLINDGIAVIIEDKTNSGDNPRKLSKYKATVARELPGYQIAAVYLKTGDECAYISAKVAGFGCFTRKELLETLADGEKAGVMNHIFVDFHRHVRGIEEAVQSFAVSSPRDWKRKQWIGFFINLQERLTDGEWAVRGHGGGGSLTFRWNRHDGRYLRLHGKKLSFCLEVPQQALQSTERDKWSQTLKSIAGLGGISIISCRRKLGRRMTVAILNGDYRRLYTTGLLDMDKTVEVLHQAKVFMDAAMTSLQNKLLSNLGAEPADLESEAMES